MIDVVIKKNNDTYVCIFRGVGWSYAECVVYKKTKLLGFIPWKSYQYASSSGFGWSEEMQCYFEHKDFRFKYKENLIGEFNLKWQGWLACYQTMEIN